MMMASNLLSRLLPPAAGSPSVYETLRQHEEASDASDVEERAGMALDEENLGERFEEYELDQADVARLGDSPPGSDPEAPFLPNDSRVEQSPTRRRPTSAGQTFNRPRWMSHHQGGTHPAEEGDDEVPASLLIEDGEGGPHALRPGLKTAAPPDASPVPGPSNTETRAQWRAARTYQDLHRDSTTPERPRRPAFKNWRGLTLVEPRERAMWRWTNVTNLDNFLKDVYDYYTGKGIWSIMLTRALNLLTFGFVVGFSTFLTMCINFQKVPHSKTMSQILVPQCTKKMSGTANFLLWLFALFWIVKVFEYLVDIRRLRHLHDFYLYLLDIPDTDIQTISWQEVVTRLMSLRDANPVTAESIGAKERRFIMGTQSKQRMDAHDIANRLMRKENYLIALFNKDILNLTLPVPFLRHRQLFGKSLEWNLNYCVLDYVFNERGQVRSLFLRDTHRRALSDGLRRRFIFAGCMNVICAPFIVIYLLISYFFRYFTEYQKNPSQIGSRQYTPLAEWKLREFNELWHLFQRRLNMSYPFASRYINQFPKDKTVQISRFVAFVAGALTSVLALASVIDPELFLGFEITPERTVLFYLGVFGTVWAVARGVVPEKTLVFDPEYALSNVIEYTHYCPAEWRGRLHSDEVRRDFSRLYQMKIVIFLEELLSLIFTPFILWFSLPQCSDRLVDFFREFTIHVDGLGYVCSFAVFDFKRGANIAVPAPPQGDQATRLREEYYSTKDGKMLASYYGFIDNYSNPPRKGSRPADAGSPRPMPPIPAMPGFGSVALASGAGIAGSARGERLARRPVRIATGPSGILPSRPGPRHRMSGGEPTASMPSSTLDGRLPPAVGVSSPLRPRATARQASPNQPAVDGSTEGALDEVIAGPSDAGVIPSHSAGTIDDDSRLGESWKTTRAAARDDGEEDGERIDGLAGDGEVGVLGLLYQFQRAQTEGRGGGVTI